MDLRLFRHKPSVPKGNIWILGNFDGVHIGHQALIKAAKSEIKAQEKIGLLTFEPHPQRFFNPNSSWFRIQKFTQKLETLDYYNVNYCYAYKFNAQTASLSAEDFCKNVIYKILAPKAIITGYDFHFGKDRSGTIEDLRTYGKKYNFEVITVPRVTSNEGIRYGSGYLREAILKGDILDFKNHTGRDYIIKGRVLEGRKIARNLGFPTANILPSGIIYPKYGVYSGKVEVKGKYHKAIANIGVKPTITNDNKPIIEIHIPDFKDNIYGDKISFIFKKFIREEKKFSNIEELKSQILLDIEQI